MAHIDTPLIRGFAPIEPSHARVLVLGSMPSERSLAEQQYYGHPRNAFWPIMGRLFGFDADGDYADRQAALERAGVALWDVLAACRREGSLDSAIRPSSIRINRIDALLARQPAICAIFFNGGTAETMWRRHVEPGLGAAVGSMHLERLPSTSPAYAAMRFDEKLACWHVVTRFSGTR